MGLDKPGKEIRAATIDRVVDMFVRRDVADGDDPSAANEHVTFDYLEGVVHRNNRGAAYDKAAAVR